MSDETADMSRIDIRDETLDFLCSRNGAEIWTQWIAGVRELRRTLKVYPIVFNYRNA